MKWSHYSEAIFDAYASQQGNIIVQACPGAGKTTNIQHMWGMNNRSKVYLVFNKHNEIEAQSRLPQIQGSDIRTLNGLGHRAVMNTFGNVTLDKNKVRDIIRKYNFQRSNRENQYTLERVVQIAKGIDVGNGISEDMYADMLSVHDMDEYPGLYSDMQSVLAMSDDMTTRIDFADQLRFPVIYNCTMPQYGDVLGDEVQDFNPVQAALIEVLGAERYVLVGDCHQSIYGFRGAMNNSMSVLAEQFACKEYPLSITYRCAKNIVKVAQGLYSDIEPWDNSPEGIVRYGKLDNEVFTEQDIVLCRMNRPLITLAYQLLRSNTPCYVRGRDIGDGLVRLIKRQGCFTVRELIGRLNEEYEVEIEKARRKEDEDKMKRIEDRYTSALLFCGRANLNDGPDVVIAAIERLFSEGRGVCLSTVHKAKGLEAKRAFLLEPDLFKSFRARAKHAWQKEQERNIEYVAVTRAKEELIYL